MEVEKLTAVDVENVLDIIDSEGLEAIIKIIDLRLSGLESDLLKFNLQENSFANLALAKARYDGANAIKITLINELKSIKRKSAQESQGVKYER